jgi:hypothetical protein
VGDHDLKSLLNAQLQRRWWRSGQLALIGVQRIFDSVNT